MISKVLLVLLALLVGGSKPCSAVNGSLSPRSLCVCPGGEATFTCSVPEPGGGVFAWITNTTTETCRVFSSSPQSQCGKFIGQLENSSLSTLTATSAATSDTGNIFIQCCYITDKVGNGTLLIADPGTPPTPILHNVTSEDIQDNGDDDTCKVTLRWTLSEPDDCSNTIHFNVTPDDPTHCGSCEFGPGGGVQEEFSCQVVQGIGQSCTYRVYAVRCGDSQNGVPSEPVEVNLTVTSTSPHPPPVTSSSPHLPPVTSSSPHPPPVTSTSPHPLPVTSSSSHPTPATSYSPHPPPVTSSSPHPPPPMTSSSPHPLPVTSSSPHPPPVTSSSPHPAPATSSSSHPTPATSSSPHPPMKGDDELSGGVIAAIVAVPLLFLIVIVVLIVVIAVLLVWKRRGGSSYPQKHQHVNDAIEMENKSVENNKPDKPLPYSGTMMTEGIADETTGQEEYAVLQHGQPQAVPNIRDPNYGHLYQDDTEHAYDVTQHGNKPQLQPFIADPNYEHLEHGGTEQTYDVTQHGRSQPKLVTPDPNYEQLEHNGEEDVTHHVKPQPLIPDATTDTNRHLENLAELQYEEVSLAPRHTLGQARGRGSGRRQ